MQIHAQVFATEAPLNQRYLRRTTPSRTLAFSRKPVGLMVKKKWCPGVPLFVDPQGNLCQFPNKDRRTIVSAVDEGKLGINTRRKRKVVEHISLLRAKEDLSEEQEKDMLDYLYTTQYQMRGIVAISLGRISDQNPEQYTHAIFMRFQAKEDLAKFYKNSFYVGVLKEHVMPYCHVCSDMGLSIWTMNLK